MPAGIDFKRFDSQNRLFPYRFLELAELAAIIAPPVPAFYARPQNLEEMIDHSVGRGLDMFDIELGVVRRWRKQAEHVLTLYEVKSCY
jgi:4-hydroxy-3-polyprenylbenzoate decarboxylase